MESILNSIKKMLGGCAEDDSFDTDIIIHINSLLSILEQKGVKPSVPNFQIEDESATWTDYLPNFNECSYIKTYIYLKVKLIFDPPANASVLKAMENEIDELDWRIDSKFNYENKVIESENQNGVV